MSSRPEVATPYRVAFISRNPSQWQGPLFARIAACPGIRPHVYYTSKVGLGVEREAEMGAVPDWGSLPVLEGYDYSFVECSLRGSLRLVRELAARRYDAVVVEGYRRLPMLLSITYATLTRTPLFLRIDSILMYEREKPNWKLKQRLLPTFFRSFTAFLPLSSLAVQYLEHLGVAHDRIFLAPYTVDNGWYARLCEEWRLRRQAVREEMGLPSDLPVALAVLRFVERERPLDLLRAVELLQQRNLCVGTILVGDGPQRAEIVDFIRSRNLQWVVLPGYQILSNLPKFYAVADMFVHPAINECWGLSVNEAMACGLPVIASDRVGASYDLVRAGENGYTFPPRDVDAFVACLEPLLADADLRERFGQRSREIISSWNYDRAVNGILEALDFVCKHREVSR
jgi:glycosyltransferase involved in cell wall biosynthesis